MERAIECSSSESDDSTSRTRISDDPSGSASYIADVDVSAIVSDDEAFYLFVANRSIRTTTEG